MSRAIRASATASSSSSARGVPGTRFSPIASAPARMAARMPSASVIPQIFTNGRARHLDQVGRGPAGRDECPGRRLRIARADERLADERGVEAEGAPAADRRGVADAGFGDDQTVIRDELAEPGGTLGIDGERAQVAVVDADHAGVASRGPLRSRARRAPRRGARARAPARGRPVAQASARGWSTASSRTASAPAARRRSSWRASTTNSLASTGTVTAARTAVRSSTEPPNQCGSHRTEIAAAPPAW